MAILAGCTMIPSSVMWSASSLLRIRRRSNVRGWQASFLGTSPSAQCVAAPELPPAPSGHPFTPSRHFSPTQCGACGTREDVDPVTPDELAGDAFWFRHPNVPWAAAAIEQFVADDGGEVVNQGRTVLAGILSGIRSLPPSAQLTELNASLIGRVKSNKMERTILLEALGYAGILPVAGHPSYADEFIAYDDAESRQPAQYYKKEWAYPIRFWTGADGVTEPALTFGSQ